MVNIFDTCYDIIHVPIYDVTLVLTVTCCLRNGRSSRDPPAAEGCISCQFVEAIASSTLSRRIRINLYLHTPSIIMLIMRGASVIHFEQTFCVLCMKYSRLTAFHHLPRRTFSHGKIVRNNLRLEAL